MQTIKTCTLDNDKQHVCFKDLENYWKKDEYFEGLSQAEMAQIRQNLGLPTDVTIDSSLDTKSKNPVQNRVITAQLNKKIDVDQLSKVGITGQYVDLRNKPCNLPNPCGLLIEGLNTLGEATQWYYDGNEQVRVNLNTKLSNFENDKCFIDKDALNTAITLSGIIVNGKVLRTDCDKYVTVDIPTKVSDLTQDINYLTAGDAARTYATKLQVNKLLSKTDAANTYLAKADVDQTVIANSTNAVSGKAVYAKYHVIEASVNSLIQRLAATETALQETQAELNSLRSQYASVVTRLNSLEGRVTALES